MQKRHEFLSSAEGKEVELTLTGLQERLADCPRENGNARHHPRTA